MKIKIKDVADKAGCSPSVVSSVLNNGVGNIRFSKDVAERVHKAALDLGYRTVHSRSKNTENKQKYVAIICYGGEINLDNMYSGLFMGVFSSLMNNAGYEVCFLPVNAKDLLSRLYNLCEIEKQLAAVVMLNHAPEPLPLEYIKKSGLPHIFVNTGEISDSNCISMDDAGGCRQMVKFLSACGKKNILYVTLDSSQHISVSIREKTMISECAAAKIEINEIINFKELSQEYLEKQLKSGIDTIVSVSGSYSKIIMLLLMHLDKKAPKDIALVAVDGLSHEDENRLFEFTRLHIPFSQMAELTARNLLDMLNSNTLSFENIVLSEFLIVGDSCTASG